MPKIKLHPVFLTSDGRFVIGEYSSLGVDENWRGRYGKRPVRRRPGNVGGAQRRR